MRKLFPLLLLCVLAQFEALASTCAVSGNLNLITGNGAAGQRVSFDPLDAPFIQGPTTFLPRAAVTTTDASGNFTINLNQGRYRMSVEGIPMIFFAVGANQTTMTISQVTPLTAIYLAGFPTNWPGVLTADASGVLSWQLQGSGTLETLNVIGGSGIGVTGSPATGNSGTITITLLSHTHDAGDLVSGVLNIARVLQSYADGQIPFGSGQQLTSSSNLWWDSTNQVLHAPTAMFNTLIANGTNSPPTSPTDPGSPGQIAYDTNYFYICTASNFWEKCSISTNGTGGGGGTWGTITGTLSAQTDLNTALNGKQATGNYITAITGDVTASGPGSAASTITSGAVTSSKLASGAAAANLAGGYVSSFSYGAIQQYQDTLTHVGTVTLDFSSTNAHSLTITGNVTFAFSNLSATKNARVIIVGCSTNSTITWPAGVHGQPPALCEANKWVSCSMESWGSNATNVIVAALPDL